MSRIDQRLSELASKNERALALFITSGYPRLDSTVKLVPELESSGADIIELGMPFSDPLADGPVIQESSRIALKNGVTLRKIFADVRALRAHSGIPIVLMGYMNPIFRFGVERFFDTAARVGVDGVIFPELPLEEAEKFRSATALRGLSLILLVTPTTPPERIAAIDAASSGFVYCVSTTGITGRGVQSPVTAYLKNVKRHARKNPVLVGFGISTPAEGRMCARYTDGIVIGSALLKRIGSGDSMKDLNRWVRGFKSALG
jgi:tryptophan synthase alpha chain